jgi:hypothetical protein
LALGVLFFLLLIVFITAFFGMESFVVNFMQAADVKVLGISMLDPGFRLFLALGIVFCQLVIIMVAMLDRVGDTIRDVIKPIFRLLPLMAFVTVSYNTFAPIVFSMLPETAAQVAGQSPNYNFAQAVYAPEFSTKIMLTVVTMVLFLITSSTLSDTRDSARVRQLEAQIKRLKRDL